VVNQRPVTRRVAAVQRLLDGVERGDRSYLGACASADDSAIGGVDQEGHMQPAAPGRDFCEVQYPQPIGNIGAKTPVDLVQWA